MDRLELAMPFFLDVCLKFVMTLMCPNPGPHRMTLGWLGRLCSCHLLSHGVDQKVIKDLTEPTRKLQGSMKIQVGTT
jgi:hypothetical protein